MDGSTVRVVCAVLAVLFHHFASQLCVSWPHILSRRPQKRGRKSGFSTAHFQVFTAQINCLSIPMYCGARQGNGLRGAAEPWRAN